MTVQVWKCLDFDPKWPQIPPHFRSIDLENPFFVIKRACASFLYVICLGLKLFCFWPQMTPNTPQFGVEWPRKALFCNQGTKSFILIYNLPGFENVWILTPNDPKYPQVTPTPNLQNKKVLSGLKLQFELFQTLIGQLCNEIFQKQN